MVITKDAGTFLVSQEAVRAFLDFLSLYIEDVNQLFVNQLLWFDFSGGNITKVACDSFNLQYLSMSFESIAVGLCGGESESNESPETDRQIKIFFVRNGLLTPSFFGEHWQDPRGVIHTRDDYASAIEWKRRFESFRDLVSSRRIVLIEGFPERFEDHFIEAFFDYYWDSSAALVYFIQAVPSCAPTDFYDLMAVAMELDNIDCVQPLRLLRKQIQSFLREMSQKVIFVIRQPIHLSSKVIDEIHEIATRLGNCSFVILRPSKQNLQRIEKLGEEPSDLFFDFTLELPFTCSELNLSSFKPFIGYPFHELPGECPIALIQAENYTRHQLVLVAGRDRARRTKGR